MVQGMSVTIVVTLSPVTWSAAKLRFILDDHLKLFNEVVDLLAVVSSPVVFEASHVTEITSVAPRPLSLIVALSEGILLDSSSNLVWLDKI